MINILSRSRQGKTVESSLVAFVTIVSLILSAVGPFPAVTRAETALDTSPAQISAEVVVDTAIVPTSNPADVKSTLAELAPEATPKEDSPVCQNAIAILLCAVEPATGIEGPVEGVLVSETTAPHGGGVIPAGPHQPMDPTVIPGVVGGILKGMVFNDQNGSHSFTVGEPGLPNWTIELHLYNPNPISDAAPLATILTDANGNYSFTNLAQGIYIVNQVEQTPTWTQTYPHGPLPIDPSGKPVPDVVSFPELIEPVPLPLPTPDNNPDEIAPVPKPIPDPNAGMPEIEEAPFPELIPLITEATEFLTEKMGLISLNQQSATPLQGKSYKVTVGPNQTVDDLDFGNFASTAISGSLWHDLNADGAWQASGTYPEPALVGWIINAANQSTKTTTTASDGSYQFVFGPSELGIWSIAESLQQNWRHTFPTNPNRHSVDLQSNGQHETGKDLGVVRFYNVVGVKFVPLSGNPSGTPEAFALDSATTQLTTNGGQTLIAVAGGTKFSRTDAQPIDVNAFTSASVAVSALSGFPTDHVARGAFEWGISGAETVMTNPVHFSFYVGTGFDGVTLNILRSRTGDAGWTNDGINTATCTVASGVCAFSATKASYYAATETISNPTPPPPPPSGGGNSGGGGGGGGSGSVTTPIPPPPPGGSTGNQPTPPPPVPQIVFANFSGGATGGNTGIAQGNIEVGGEVEVGIEDETGSPTDEEGDSEEIDGTTDTETDNAGFLGAAGNILTLGTGNALIGWIVALALLALVFYAFRRFREREEVRAK